MLPPRISGVAHDDRGGGLLATCHHSRLHREAIVHKLGVAQSPAELPLWPERGLARRLVVVVVSVGGEPVCWMARACACACYLCGLRAYVP